MSKNHSHTTPTKIVYKITPEIDPAEVLCTTYQMRNMYAQFGDGFISNLDVMNFIQHHSAALMARSGDRVLDVCCGRALMLPLLRWYRPKIHSYTGVDIHPQNFLEATRRSATKDISDRRLAPNTLGEGEPYYPFPVYYVEANAAEMADLLYELEYAPFDFVIYTASIEHMQRDAGERSLYECYRVMRPGAKLFLSSPNTSNKQNPYDTQYAAHLYEWPRDELLQVATQAGFRLLSEFGLTAKVRGYEEKLRRYYPELVPIFHRMREYLPSAWLYSVFPVLTPKIADEILLILQK